MNFLHVACQIISYYCDQGVSLLQLIYNFMSVIHMRVTLCMRVVLRSLIKLKKNMITLIDMVAKDIIIFHNTLTFPWKNEIFLTE